MMSRPHRVLTQLRRIARSLPSTSEAVTFGHPTFRAGTKTFAVLERYGDDDVVCFKATLEDQALLILDPRYVVAPYVGHHGWTSLRLGGGVDEGELEELLRSSYRLVATKHMLRELEGARARPRRARKTKKTKKTKKK